MSFNIREKFRERRFSYKFKKKLDKVNELEEKDIESIQYNPLRIIIFSPFIVASYIKKIVNYFHISNTQTLNTNKDEQYDNLLFDNINENKLIKQNNLNNHVLKYDVKSNKSNINISGNTIDNKQKSSKGFIPRIVPLIHKKSIFSKNKVNANQKQNNNSNKFTNENYELILLENKIFTKFQKFLQKLDTQFSEIESETYLTNKYSSDDDILKEAILISSKIKTLLDKLNKVKEEYMIIEDEMFIKDPSILDDFLLIDDIYSYLEIINTCDQNIIPQKLKLLDEYCHLYINLEKLEDNIINIKNVRDGRVEELSQRDKKFNNTKVKINHLDEISENCDNIINKHNKYLDEISSKVLKIDEQKFIKYKLKGLNGLLSSSLKYIGLIGLSPLRGLIPSIAVKTVATRKLISGMIKDIHYEKNEKTIYSVHNYIAEIDNKIFDINNVNKNIDKAYDEVQQLKNEFREYYFKYHFKEYDEAYKKIEKIEEDIINNKKKVLNIQKMLLKNRDENKKVLKKVKSLTTGR